MRERSRELRDRVVWVLARLSLTVLLAMMAALFVGSAAHAEVSEAAKISGEGLGQANPLGLVLIGLVVAVGVGVLVFGAFRPQRRHSASDLADLLRD